jgi:uncharacterized membrane protein
MAASLRELHRRDDGAIALLATFCLVLVVGFGSLAVDLGSFYWQRRTLQGVADLAALAAADALSSPAAATDPHAAAATAAAAVVTANGWPRAVLAEVDVGRWEADTGLAPTDRFHPDATAGINAAHVRLATRVEMFLGRPLLALIDPDEPIAEAGVALHVVSTATNTRLAAFAVGSRLAQLEGGIENALLRALIGSEVDLSAVDYDGLAHARVDLLTFAGALATRLRLEGPTYDEVLDLHVSATDLLQATASAARASSGSNTTAVTVLGRLAAAAAGGSTSVDLSRLLDLGPLGGMPIDGGSLIGTSVSVLDLVNAAAGIATGDHVVDVDLGATVPGLASAKVRLVIGERPVGSPWIAVGATGTTVHTAQVRLLVDVTVGGPSPLPLLRLPLYAEIAAAQATVRRITCEPAGVTIAARPAVASLWIAGVTAADLVEKTAIPSPPPATLVSLPLVGNVTGRSEVSITNLRDTDLAFSAADIQNHVAKTTSTTAFTTSLVTTLLSHLQLALNGLPLPIGPLATTLAKILSLATVPLDALLAAVLQTLGVSLGQAVVWVDGVRCDGAVLVY